MLSGFLRFDLCLDDFRYHESLSHTSLFVFVSLHSKFKSFWPILISISMSTFFYFFIPFTSLLAPLPLTTPTLIIYIHVLIVCLLSFSFSNHFISSIYYAICQFYTKRKRENQNKKKETKLNELLNQHFDFHCESEPLLSQHYLIKCLYLPSRP